MVWMAEGRKMEDEATGQRNQTEMKKRKREDSSNHSEVSPQKMKLENLLVDDSSQSPIISFPEMVFPSNETSVSTKKEKTFSRFDNENPLHVVLENLNESRFGIRNSTYEALKIQEFPHGGPRPSKLQLLGLMCENIQFLELFSLKQLHSFESPLVLPKLRTLRIFTLIRLTNQGLSQLISAAPRLEELFLKDLPIVTSLCIRSHFNDLVTLDMQDCKSVETLQIENHSLQSFFISDGRSLTSLIPATTNVFANLLSFRIHGCPKLPFYSLYALDMRHLRTFELISNAPSAKAYMEVNENAFHAFAKRNFHALEELVLEKVHNISLETVLCIFDQCKDPLTRVIVDLTSIEKPRVKDALRKCVHVKEWKVEKWYIKKKWTEW